MLFKCLPEGAPIPGRFPGPVHARGKWFTIDIHCHVRSDQGDAAGRGQTQDVSRWFLETQASPQSRAINRANGERTNEQSVSPEKRIADMDRMGIDIQAISPAPRQTYYGAEPDLGLASVARDQRLYRRDLRQISRSFCRARHGAVPGARARRRRARPPAQVARLSRHRDHDPCRRRGFVGRALSQDLRALRRAGPAGVHALRRVYRGRALRQSLLRQRDRQPARHDGGIASPDLWRRAAGLSRI